MSGVKNLRAMFEQKGETSPPDRGRSPGIPWTPSPSSDSPRPLSKVRTNFIAIEKDGRIGLQRETSQDSILSVTRKLSGGSDVPTPPAIQQDSDVFGTSMAKASPAKTDLKDQPIPESPRTETGGPTNAPPKTATESNLQTPSDTRTRSKKLGLDGATEVTKPTSNGSSSHGEPPAKHLNGVDRAKDKDKLPNKDVEKVQAKSTAKASPKPIATSSAKTVAKPTRSPTVAKVPKNPAEMPAAKTQSKATEKAPQPGDKGAAPRASATSSKATVSSSSIKRPPPLLASPSSGVGFVKPKPKSPTRPVKLPASLTTHTAASGSRLNGPRQSLSRGSGAINSVDSVGRSPSRGSVSTVATSSARLSGVQGLKRQSSTINRPRPSIGPPPKQPARDHPPTKKEKEIDQGFLARMTRPTQAFTQKTVGKSPTTPPRKSSAAPIARKPLSSDSHLPVAKKPVTANSQAQKRSPKTGSSASQPKATSGPSTPEPESSTAKEIAIQVEQAETAEELIETAKAVEGHVSLSEEQSKQKTAAEETAPIVEQSEAADDSETAAESEAADEVVEVATDVEASTESAPSLGQATEIEDAIQQALREHKDAELAKQQAQETEVHETKVDDEPKSNGVVLNGAGAGGERTDAHAEKEPEVTAE